MRDLESKKITFVGDRGMIKKPQIEELSDSDYYITAITKPEMQTFLAKEIIKLEDFKEEVSEFEENGVRYIFRRNPTRQKEITATRNEKFSTVKKLVDEKNNYLRSHTRASVDIALRAVKSKINSLKISKWLTVRKYRNVILLKKNEQALKEESGLDGCYVLKTNLPESFENSSDAVHDRYKDLFEVEYAFRTMKTGHLEIRPCYVRKASRTEGHVFVVMLAYKIVRELRKAWQSFNITVEEGIRELGSICSMYFSNATSLVQFIPNPRSISRKLLEVLDIKLPEAIISKGINVAAKKKLQSERL